MVVNVVGCEDLKDVLELDYGTCFQIFLVQFEIGFLRKDRVI